MVCQSMYGRQMLSHKVRQVDAEEKTAQLLENDSKLRRIVFAQFTAKLKATGVAVLIACGLVIRGCGLFKRTTAFYIS